MLCRVSRQVEREEREREQEGEDLVRDYPEIDGQFEVVITAAEYCECDE